MSHSPPRWKTNRAARELGLGVQRVRDLADAGVLACERTDDGTRLFRPDDVRALAERRAADVIARDYAPLAFVEDER